jgi:hypothetical protein
MSGRIFALFLLVFIFGCGAPISAPSPNVVQIPPGEIEQLQYETMENGEQRLRVRPNIQSYDDLLAYREMKIQEAKEILDATKDQSAETPYYPVVVTMRRPVTLSELNNLIRDYNPTTKGEVSVLLNRNVKALPKADLVKNVDFLLIDQVKFVSSTGNGQLSYETLSDPVSLANLESKLAARDMKYNGTSSYELIKGITSVTGGIHREQLLNLENEPAVFLADIGPMDLYEGKAAAALWGDVYAEVERYIDQ